MADDKPKADTNRTSGSGSPQSKPKRPASKPSSSGTTKSAKKAPRQSGVEGNGLIDPPVIPSYERELAEASALANQDLIDEVYERYGSARDKLADKKAAAA